MLTLAFVSKDEARLIEVRDRVVAAIGTESWGGLDGVPGNVSEVDISTYQGLTVYGFYIRIGNELSDAPWFGIQANRSVCLDCDEEGEWQKIDRLMLTV